MINSSLGMCMRTRTIDSNFLKENGTYGSCSYINEPARSRQRGAEVLWLADSCLARWHLRTRHTPKSVQGIKVGDVTSQGRYTLDMTPRKEKWYKRKKSISAQSIRLHLIIRGLCHLPGQGTSLSAECSPPPRRWISMSLVGFIWNTITVYCFHWKNSFLAQLVRLKVL